MTNFVGIGSHSIVDLDKVCSFALAKDTLYVKYANAEKDMLRFHDEQTAISIFNNLQRVLGLKLTESGK